MTTSFKPEEYERFKELIKACGENPNLLRTEPLSFLKEYIEKLGGAIPKGKIPESRAPGSTFQAPEQEKEPEVQSEFQFQDAEEEESDLELDMSGVIEPEEDEPQEMVAMRTSTEEEINEACEYRSKAAEAFSNQNYQEAIELYTKAIKLNPEKALYYAKRGQAYLKLQKPNCCIRDCDMALQLNPDSAAAYKYRGRARRLLGKFELAAEDLRQACKIDFDEEADEWLREVTPNAKKIAEKRLKQNRKKLEKEMNSKQEQKTGQAKQQQQPKGPSPFQHFGPDIANAFQDKDIQDALKDPEIAAAMQDLMMNPANIMKYKDNKKLLDLVQKTQTLLTGGGFFPPGGGRPPTSGEDAKPKSDAAPPKTDFADDGLD